LTTRDVYPNPDRDFEVSRLTEALQAPAPAFFVIWQDGVDSAHLFIDACIKVGATEIKSIHIKGMTGGIDWLEDLKKDLKTLGEKVVIVLLGCLSAVEPDRRPVFNRNRGFWEKLGRIVLFVEPIDREAELKRDFDHLFALTRDEVKLYGPENPSVIAISSEKVAAADPPTAAGPVVQHFGEVIEVDARDAVCWVEMVPGRMVKTRVPLSVLAHLRPRPGLAFVWVPEGTELRPEHFRPRQFPAPSPEEQEEEERLRRKFHENVDRGRLFLAEDQ
jgi:hypothetical protein